MIHKLLPRSAHCLRVEIEFRLFVVTVVLVGVLRQMGMLAASGLSESRKPKRAAKATVSHLVERSMSGALVVGN